MPCYSPLKGWKCEDSGGIVFRASARARERMEVSCGACLGCRLDYSRMWAMRIVHESGLPEHTGGTAFITLTYRDKDRCTDEQLRDGYHVPDDWSLNKKHFQDFMKRLRKDFAPQRIRFYHCGEYGKRCRHGVKLDEVSCYLCTLGRPHYHAALFNCSFDDLESYGSENGDLRYTSPRLERIWKYGNVDVGELNFESAAYIARYVLKKVTGKMADDHYMAMDEDTGEIYWKNKEYVTMSRRPGIGRNWYELYKDDVFPSDEVPVVGKGVLKGVVPRYYEEIFANENPLEMEEIKAVRDKFFEEHGHDYTPERLMDKYKVKKAQVDMLKRTIS